jgi:hypothetical protein
MGYPWRKQAARRSIDPARSQWLVPLTFSGRRINQYSTDLLTPAREAAFILSEDLGLKTERTHSCYAASSAQRGRFRRLDTASTQCAGAKGFCRACCGHALCRHACPLSPNAGPGGRDRVGVQAGRAPIHPFWRGEIDVGDKRPGIGMVSVLVAASSRCGTQDSKTRLSQGLFKEDLCGRYSSQPAGMAPSLPSRCCSGRPCASILLNGSHRSGAQRN